MLDYTLKKYFDNYKILVPYLLVQLIMNIITEYSINIKTSNLIAKQTLKSIFSTYTKIPIFLILVIIFLILSCYINLLTKKILDDEKINHLQTLKESLKYFWRFIGVSLIVLLIWGAAIILCMAVAEALPGLGLILAVIAMGYILIMFGTADKYLFYANSTIGEALSNAKEIGRKNFANILGFILVTGIISKILEIEVNNLLLSNIMYFVNINIDVFTIFYLMSLCKEFIIEEQKNEEEQEF